MLISTRLNIQIVDLLSPLSNTFSATYPFISGWSTHDLFVKRVRHKRSRLQTSANFVDVLGQRCFNSSHKWFLKFINVPEVLLGDSKDHFQPLRSSLCFSLQNSTCHFYDGNHFVRKNPRLNCTTTMRFSTARSRMKYFWIMSK